MPIAL